MKDCKEKSNSESSSFFESAFDGICKVDEEEFDECKCEFFNFNAC